MGDLSFPLALVGGNTGGGGGGGSVDSVNGRTGNVLLTANDVDLANVNNTSDANKPVSTAQAAANGVVASNAAADATAKANAAQAFAIQRANHTGTQLANTISDFVSAARAQIEAALIAGDNVTIVGAGTGASRTLTVNVPNLTAIIRNEVGAMLLPGNDIGFTPAGSGATLTLEVDYTGTGGGGGSSGQSINVYRFTNVGAGPYNLPSTLPYDTTQWNVLWMQGVEQDPADYTLTASTLSLGTAIDDPAIYPRGTLQYVVSTADIVPDGFTFTPVTGATASSTQTSNTIVVNGINAPSPLTITGGQYSINGGGYASTPTTVVIADTVTVRTTASGTAGATVSAVLTIGGVSGSFDVTTAASGTPSPEIQFLTAIEGTSGRDRASVPLSSVLQSNAVTLDGFTGPLAISVSGPGSVQYCVNYDTVGAIVSTLPGSRAWTSTPGTVNPGDIVRIRQTMPATNSTIQVATMVVGGTTALFECCTVSLDPTVTFPAADPLCFPTATGSTPNTLYTSNTITITGVTGGTAAGCYVLGGEMSKNGGAFSSAMTTISNNDTIQLRGFSSPDSGSFSGVFLRVGTGDRTFLIRNTNVRSATATSNIDWAGYGKLNTPIAPYINQARRGPAIAVGPVIDIPFDELPGDATPTYATDYFYVVPSGGATSPISGAALIAGETVFTQPVDASSRTSGGTQYSRTEMREQISLGTDSVNWGVAVGGVVPGTHIQEGICRATSFSAGIPISPGTCGSMSPVTSTVGQIHGVDEPDMVQIRISKSFSGSGTSCSLEPPRVRVALQPNASGPQTFYPTSGTFEVIDGSYFGYKITVTGGQVRVQLARNLASLTGSFPWGAASIDQFDTGAFTIINYVNGFYFKAGLYLQDIKFRYNGDVNDNTPNVVINGQYSGSAEIVYRLLDVSHT